MPSSPAPVFFNQTNTMQGLIPVIVPAAGVGKRMQSTIPKQYLMLDGKTVLEQTVERLLSHSQVGVVIVAISPEDAYFSDLTIANHERVIRVNGGKERCDSVLAGLNYLIKKSLLIRENELVGDSSCQESPWVMVHDAARPCVTHEDISKLIEQCNAVNCGGILAKPVSDTMKQAQTKTVENKSVIHQTIDRDLLWHALTPQMFPLITLHQALESSINQQLVITDEASAMELNHYSPILVTGRADNIKITQPSDLDLARFYLQQQ